MRRGSHSARKLGVVRPTLVALEVMQTLPISGRMRRIGSPRSPTGLADFVDTCGAAERCPHGADHHQYARGGCRLWFPHTSGWWVYAYRKLVVGP
jgi:hypothetical protein